MGTTMAMTPSSRLSPTTCALLLVDLQLAFFTRPPLQERRAAVARQCQQLVDAARAASVPVLNLVTEHRRDASTWTLAMLDDGQGFAFTGTLEARPLPELDLAHARTVVKTRDSGFHGTALDATLRSLGVRTVVLAGVSTHACVRATATDAYAHDLRVVVVSDAVASDDPERGERALHEMAEDLRAEVVTTREVISAWPAP